MPSDPDRTKVRHPSPVLGIGVPRALSRPATPEDSPSAAADASPPHLPQALSAPSGKPKVRLPEDGNQPKSAASPNARLPLLVDFSQLPFEGAGGCGTLSDAARVLPVASPAGLFADPLGHESLPDAPLRHPVHWPEIITGGGATCSGPRNSGHNMPSRNKLGHEPMGKVTLLGASLRPLQSERGLLPRAELAEAGDTVVESLLEKTAAAVEKGEIQGEVEAVLRPDGEEVPRNMRKLNEEELQAGVDQRNPMSGGQTIMNPSAPVVATLPSLATQSFLATTGQGYQVTPQLAKEVTASPPPKRSPKAKHTLHLKGTSDTSHPQAEQTAPACKRPFALKAAELDKAEICFPTSDETVATEPQPVPVQVIDMHPVVVSTCEVSLQTDALPTELAGHANVKFKESAAEHQRILILRCCDRRQVDFARWTPIPKAEPVLSPEMRYLGHVRNRFPGTIVGGCLAEGRHTLANHRSIATKH